MRCSSTQHHSLLKLFKVSFQPSPQGKAPRGRGWGSGLVEIQERIRGIQEGVAGTLTHLSSIKILFTVLTIL